MRVRRQGRPTERQALGVAKDPLIDELIAACITARNGLERPALEADRQVEDAFFRAAAALETFLSEWLVRCLSFDAARLRATYEQRAAQQALADLDLWEPSKRLWKDRGARPSVVVTLPISAKHSLQETRALLGAVDDNVTIRGTEDLIKRSQDVLVDKYARRARMLGKHRAATLDATVAIRNVLAHRSDRSTTSMNQCLQSSKMPSTLRRHANKVSAKGVGFYLRADGGGARPRFETYFSELAEVAHILAPTDGRRRVVCPPSP